MLFKMTNFTVMGIPIRFIWFFICFRSRDWLLDDQ
nr:MAG TPA: hypothetical protein [Bacteriophage sp.]